MITITRDPMQYYGRRGAPWIYSYSVQGGPTVQYWGTSLTSLRALLRRKYPDHTVVCSWR